jgi:hypothetical protein
MRLSLVSAALLLARVHAEDSIGINNNVFRSGYGVYLSTSGDSSGMISSVSGIPQNAVDAALLATSTFQTDSGWHTGAVASVGARKFLLSASPLDGLSFMSENVVFGDPFETFAGLYASEMVAFEEGSTPPAALPVATAQPTAGSACGIVTGASSVAPAHIVLPESSEIGKPPSQMLVSASPRSRDAGGAVVDVQGSLLGVVTGSGTVSRVFEADLTGGAPASRSGASTPGWSGEVRGLWDDETVSVHDRTALWALAVNNRTGKITPFHSHTGTAYLYADMRQSGYAADAAGNVVEMTGDIAEGYATSEWVMGGVTYYSRCHNTTWAGNIKVVTIDVTGGSLENVGFAEDIVGDIAPGPGPHLTFLREATSSEVEGAGLNGTSFQHAVLVALVPRSAESPVFDASNPSGIDTLHSPAAGDSVTFGESLVSAAVVGVGAGPELQLSFLSEATTGGCYPLSPNPPTLYPDHQRGIDQLLLTSDYSALASVKGFGSSTEGLPSASFPPDTSRLTWTGAVKRVPNCLSSTAECELGVAIPETAEQGFVRRLDGSRVSADNLARLLAHSSLAGGASMTVTTEAFSSVSV